jgi:hypothetical protein
MREHFSTVVGTNRVISKSPTADENITPPTIVNGPFNDPVRAFRVRPPSGRPPILSSPSVRDKRRRRALHDRAGPGGPRCHGLQHTVVTPPGANLVIGRAAPGCRLVFTKR